jgi:hypothetical protein
MPELIPALINNAIKVERVKYLQVKELMARNTNVYVESGG